MSILIQLNGLATTEKLLHFWMQAGEHPGQEATENSMEAGYK